MERLDIVHIRHTHTDSRLFMATAFVSWGGEEKKHTQVTSKLQIYFLFDYHFLCSAVSVIWHYINRFYPTAVKGVTLFIALKKSRY